MSTSDLKTATHQLQDLGLLEIILEEPKEAKQSIVLVLFDAIRGNEHLDPEFKRRMATLEMFYNLVDDNEPEN